MKTSSKIVIAVGICSGIALMYYVIAYHFNNKLTGHHNQRFHMTNPVVPTEEEAEVNRIWDTAETAKEKELATNKLIAIVKDSQANILLRTAAIRKLGDVGALEAQDIAKDISDTSVWISKASDIERDFISKVIQEKLKGVSFGDEWNKKRDEIYHDLYVDGGICKLDISTEKLIQLVIEKESDINRQEEARRKLENIGLKNCSLLHDPSYRNPNWKDMIRPFIGAANGTYHRLRYLRETDPEKKYQLLLDALKNGPDYWATEQLILNGEERALPYMIEMLKYHRGGSDEEEEYINNEITEYKIKFAIMKESKKNPDVFEKVMRGKYSFPYKFNMADPDDEDGLRESVERWAARIAGFETDDVIPEGMEKYKKIKNPSKDNPDQKNK